MFLSGVYVNKWVCVWLCMCIRDVWALSFGQTYDKVDVLRMFARASVSGMFVGGEHTFGSELVAMIGFASQPHAHQTNTHMVDPQTQPNISR